MGGVGCRGRGTLCPQDPPAAAALLRPRPGVARDTALCGPLEGAAPANPPPGRAGVVAARLRVSRARRLALRRCLGPGAGRRRAEGGGTKGWVPAGRHLAKTRLRVGGPTCRPREEGGGGAGSWTCAPTRNPRLKMPVRGDRGFPPRREMSGWLQVSALLRPAWLGEGSRGRGTGARGGLPRCALGGWDSPIRRWG